MLSLILFRHAKSDWDAPFASDHERPLAARGIEAARCMGRLLHQMQQMPGLAVSSSAQRTRDTLQLAARAGRWECEMRIESGLYEATPEAVTAWIRRLDDAPDSVLLVGHEPTWSSLAGQLTGGSSLRVPTACMLRIDFDCTSWSEIAPGRGQLRWLLPPKVVCRNKPHR